MLLVVMAGIKVDGIAATSEARGGAAGGEEDLIGGLTDIILVKAFKVSKRPREIIVLGVNGAGDR
jgi:hypothetical protein